VDGIIDPVETRKYISRGLEAANHNPDWQDFKTGVFQV
jgi:acetyl-CoA carboxylase carboxyltransferase component